MENKKSDRILKLLEEKFPDAKSELIHTNPFQLLISTILSAQCTDERVNKVTPELFREYPTPQLLSQAELKDIIEIIHSTGFFNNKAKNIKACAIKIVENFNDKVPDNIEDLLTLPGVARKTANVVLYNSFGKNEGIAVDTHVKRISQVLGLTQHTSPEKIELDLMKQFPQEKWGFLSQALVLYGRYYCKAKKHDQTKCFLGGHD